MALPIHASAVARAVVAALHIFAGWTCERFSALTGAELGFGILDALSAVRALGIAQRCLAVLSRPTRFADATLRVLGIERVSGDLHVAHSVPTAIIGAG
jgi:hypothetical protein